MPGILGILLAGGSGSRLGGDRPKALVRLSGRTLLDRALAVLGELCDEVIVVAPASLVLPVAPAMRVSDPPGIDGPLAGLAAGLAARPFEGAVVLGVDFPLMRADTLRALLGRLEARAAVVPAPGGLPQPLAAAYAPEAGALLERQIAAGERALLPAVARLDPLLVREPELAVLPGGLDVFLNVNRPEDLTRAETLLRA